MQKHNEMAAVKDNGFGAQLPKNLIANIAYFIVNLIIGLILVPYFVSTLGVAAYGLIPLATSITGYVGIVVQSLNTSVSRYLTVDLQQEDFTAANQTFNTAIFGLSLLLLLMVPVLVIVAYFIPDIFNVPAGYETDAILLFLGVSASFLIRSWSGNFTVQLFACNRLDLQNVVNIVNIIVQTGLIALFFTLYRPNLAFVGLAYLIGAISASVMAIMMAKRVCPHLKISIRSVNLSRLKLLTNMSWWVIVNQIGTLLFIQIDLIVVNMLFGATSAGEYAVVLNWGVLLRNVASMIAGVLTPMVFTYYAKEQITALINMMRGSVKMMGFLMALPIGFICGFAPQILTIWVGEKFTYLAPLMVLMVFHLTINLSVMPLFPINVAYNKIRVPGIVTLLMGMMNIALAILLPLLAGWGFYGVAAAGAIVLTLKNAVFTPWYATRVMNIKALTFAGAMLPGIISAITIAIAGWITGALLPVTSLTTLVITGVAITIVYSVLLWQFGLSSLERKIFKSYMPGIAEKIRKSASRN
jgi:O-antigen/teichoic acid export membrane protein